MRLHTFLEKVAEGLVAEAGNENDLQGPQPIARRLVGRNHFPYRIPATQGKAEGKSQRCRVCVDKGKHRTGKATVK